YSAGRTSIFFFQAEDGIRDFHVTGVQTCALPILAQSVAQLFAEHGGRVAEPESPGPGPGLLVDVVEGRDPADFDRHLGPSAAAEGFSSRPRVIVRLTRIRGDGEPRLPAWFDPLGIGGGCPAVKAAV